MKLFIIITLTLFILVNNKQIKPQNKIQNQIIKVSVNGLVCDFCARSIEKLFKKKESVESINVNLENMLITINLEKGKNINDASIIKVINDSGYDVTGINRER